MKNKTASPIQLPQTSESWFVCVRELPLNFIDGEATALAVLLILNSTLDEAIRLDIYDSTPDPEFVRQQVWKTISQPELKGQSPHRPKEIFFEQDDLFNVLSAPLHEIRVGAHLGDPPPIIDELIIGLSQSLVNSPHELPGLLSVPGTNPKMIASLFSCAADFYRAAPWKRLADYQTLAVFIDPPGQQLYVQVMGNGGIEYGLTYYTSWEDVLRLFEHTDSPVDSLPDAGVHGLTFETKTDLPPEDQTGMRKYGWKTAGRKACPLPVTFTKEGEAERPGRQDLLFLEALMRSLPGFIEDQLIEDEQGDYKPAETIIETRHFDGPVSLVIRYPAGELPILDVDEDSSIDDKEPIRLPASLVEANRLAGQAWDEDEPEDRLRLAKDALDISPDCTEAFLILANEAESLEAAQDWLEKAVQAGGRALGEEFMVNHNGSLWDWKEARPYLRACAGLAENLEALGRKEEALAEYTALLGLNDEDHQGARYHALRLLMQLKRDNEAQDLIDKYVEEGSSTWDYSTALLAFRKQGDQAKSRNALMHAIQNNPFVPEYLTGLKPLPAEEPEAIGFGDESEAVHYVFEYYTVWWSTPGAVDWLKQNG